MKLSVANPSLHQIEDQLALALRQHDGSGIFRFETYIQPVRLINWLQKQSSAQKVYWSDRKQQLEAAGIGEAFSVRRERLSSYKSLFDELGTAFNDRYPNLRFYGGLQFSLGNGGGGDWNHFGAYRFWIPKYEIVHENEDCRFSANVRFTKDIRVESLANEIYGAICDTTVTANLPAMEDHQLLNRENYPNERDWEAMVNSALKSIAVDDYHKVVLARKSVFTFAENLNPLFILNKLRNYNPESMSFCIQPENEVAFIGASPELLYRRCEDSILSDAIAGTRERGKTADLDAQMEKELLDSDKDRREHRFVSDSVLNMLQSVCKSVKSSGDVQVLKLARIQHLYRRFEGKLQEAIGDAEIIAGLHPTPAVGGFPDKEARAAIKELEPFARGWFAAPVGWVSKKSAEFAVAIRSGLVENNVLSLYSGAGIVAGSVPGAEWNEIESKIINFLKALAINGESNSKQEQPVGLFGARRIG